MAEKSDNNRNPKFLPNIYFSLNFTKCELNHRANLLSVETILQFFSLIVTVAEDDSSHICSLQDWLKGPRAGMTIYQLITWYEGCPFIGLSRRGNNNLYFLSEGQWNISQNLTNIQKTEMTEKPNFPEKNCKDSAGPQDGVIQNEGAHG